MGAAAALRPVHGQSARAAERAEASAAQSTMVQVKSRGSRAVDWDESIAAVGANSVIGAVVNPATAYYMFNNSPVDVGAASDRGAKLGEAIRLLAAAGKKSGVPQIFMEPRVAAFGGSGGHCGGGARARQAVAQYIESAQDFASANTRGALHNAAEISSPSAAPEGQPEPGPSPGTLEKVPLNDYDDAADAGLEEVELLDPDWWGKHGVVLPAWTARSRWAPTSRSSPTTT